MKNIIYHADDFGANREISEHILDCYRDGALNSLSILPNSPNLSQCMELLKPYQDNIQVSIHFNLAEGPCVAELAKVPWLVDKRGMFTLSFFKVLLYSFTGKRKELKRQIQTEMQAQLKRMLPYISSLRIDSHQHYHMIPVVLESVLGAAEALTKEGCEVPAIEFIRIPAEPIVPFLKHPGLWATYKPINWVKNIVLNVLNRLDGKKLKPYRKKTAVFWGILMSGGMDLKRVSVLRADFEKIAKRKRLPLELLCHPGGVEKPDELMDGEDRSCVEFYTAEGRKIEKEMLLEIR